MLRKMLKSGGQFHVTGSNGKTTTKNILRDLVTPLFPVAASPSRSSPASSATP